MLVVTAQSGVAASEGNVEHGHRSAHDGDSSVQLLSCAIHYSLPVPRAWLWVIAERSEYSSVDPQRLEQDVGIVERKHIRRCQFAGVLGDDGIRRLLRSRVQVRLEDGPAVPSWSVLLKEG